MKSKIIGGKDRCYYRAEPTSTLIEEAKYYPSIELCIVLGERLEQAEKTKGFDYCPHCDTEL